MDAFSAEGGLKCFFNCTTGVQQRTQLARLDHGKSDSFGFPQAIIYSEL